MNRGKLGGMFRSFRPVEAINIKKMSLILFTTESQMDLFGALGFNTGDELDEHSRREVYQHYIKQC